MLDAAGLAAVVAAGVDVAAGAAVVVLVLAVLAALVSSEPLVPAIAGDTARLKTKKHPSKARIHFLLRLTANVNP
jgi:hypothetical protein